MKKLYSAPLMEIETFDVCDIITTSGGTSGGQTGTPVSIEYNSSTGTNEVQIQAQW